MEITPPCQPSKSPLSITISDAMLMGTGPIAMDSCAQTPVSAANSAQ